MAIYGAGSRGEVVVGHLRHGLVPQSAPSSSRPGPHSEHDQDHYEPPRLLHSRAFFLAKLKRRSGSGGFAWVRKRRRVGNFFFLLCWKHFVAAFVCRKGSAIT